MKRGRDKEDLADCGPGGNIMIGTREILISCFTLYQLRYLLCPTICLVAMYIHR